MDRVKIMNYFTKKLLIILITAILLSATSQVLAARLYFEPSKGNFSAGSVLSVELKINTEDVPINTIEGYLKFSKDFFSLEGLSDGNSIISFWVKKPVAENGLVSFAGIIPGGYGGRDGTLIKILLKSIKTGQGKIEIEPNSQVLLNDGQGTQAEVKYNAASFNITKSGIDVTVIRDIEPPESFSPQIASDPNIFGGQWFLTFSTQDKNSGIDHYEMQESGKIPVSDKWVTAESPYLLKDQKLYRYIYVRAIDKAGNEKIAFLPPTFVPWYKKPIVDIVVGAIILIVLLLIRWLWRKLKHK